MVNDHAEDKVPEECNVTEAAVFQHSGNAHIKVDLAAAADQQGADCAVNLGNHDGNGDGFDVAHNGHRAVERHQAQGHGHRCQNHDNNGLCYVISLNAQCGGKAKHRTDGDIQVAVGVDKGNARCAGTNDDGLAQDAFHDGEFEEPSRRCNAEDQDHDRQHYNGEQHEKVAVIPDDVEFVFPGKVQILFGHFGLFCCFHGCCLLPLNHPLDQFAVIVAVLAVKLAGNGTVAHDQQAVAHAHQFGQLFRNHDDRKSAGT